MVSCNPQPSETESNYVEEEVIMDDAEEPAVITAEGEDFYLDPEGNVVYTFLIAENMPSFAGSGTLDDYLLANLKYPIQARENESEGTVIVDFVVAPDGSIHSARVIKPAEDDLLNQEALRVVNSMPSWNPGLNDGKAVAYRYSLPIVFKLKN